MPSDLINTLQQIPAPLQERHEHHSVSKILLSQVRLAQKQLVCISYGLWYILAWPRGLQKVLIHKFTVLLLS